MYEPDISARNQYYLPVCGGGGAVIRFVVARTGRCACHCRKIPLPEPLELLPPFIKIKTKLSSDSWKK